MSRCVVLLLLWPSTARAWTVQNPDELPRAIAGGLAGAPDPLIPFELQGEFQTSGNSLSASSAILTHWSSTTLQTRGFKLSLESGQLTFSVALFDGSGIRASTSQKKVLDDNKPHRFQAVATAHRIQVRVDGLFGYSSDGGCTDTLEAGVECGFGLFDPSLAWVIGGDPSNSNHKFNGTLSGINVIRPTFEPQRTAADPDSSATPAPSPQLEKDVATDVLVYAVGIPLLLIVLGVLIGVAALGAWWFMKKRSAAARAPALPAPTAAPAVAAPPTTVVAAFVPGDTGAAKKQLSTPRKPSDEPVLPPSSWSSMQTSPGGSALAQASSELRKAVQELMDKTWKSTVTRDRKRAGAKLSDCFEVVQVLRNENMKLWREYVLKRRSIKLSKDDVRVEPLTAKDRSVLDELEGDCNECYLFHGSKPSSIQDICQNDFLLKLAGGHRGTLYGRGIYFAESSTKADEYAEDDRDGIYKGLFAMLLCRVTLGRPLVTEEVRPDTAALEAACMGPSATHNSVLGDREKAVGTYREFVVFDTTQAYPEFCILYRRNDS